MEKLTIIQNELKVPKTNVNAFGKYKYRSAEDILEAVKPLLLKNGCTLRLTDEIILVGVKVFLKATAIIFDGTNKIMTSGFAETSEHKGMSAEQTTGTASSYARKYALNGLFLIDETMSDPDSQKQEPKITPQPPLPSLTTERFKNAITSIQNGEIGKEKLDAFTLTEEQQTILKTI